jgi:hypothetical protein
VFKKIFAVCLSCAFLSLVLFPSTMVAAPYSYNSHDFNKLQTFLNQTSVETGIKNGKVLNTSYNQDDPTTWTGVIWTGGAGAERRVTEIKWSGKNKLAGNLDVSECTALWQLDCGFNNLYSINVWGCTGLQVLYCHNTAISSLDVSSLKSLRNLSCCYTWLSALNVSGLSALEYLNCGYNTLLTSLNISGCSALKTLICSNAPLASLNISGLTST